VRARACHAILHAARGRSRVHVVTLHACTFSGCRCAPHVLIGRATCGNVEAACVIVLYTILLKLQHHCAFAHREQHMACEPHASDLGGHLSLAFFQTWHALKLYMRVGMFRAPRANLHPPQSALHALSGLDSTSSLSQAGRFPRIRAQAMACLRLQLSKAEQARTLSVHPSVWWTKYQGAEGTTQPHCNTFH